MIKEVTQSFKESYSFWLQKFLEKLPELLIALLVLLIFIFIAKIARKLSTRSFARFKVGPTLTKLLANTFYILVITLGLFLSLSVLGLDKAVTSMLAGVGILGIALGFAFQDIASNYISGAIIAFQKPFRKGDQIETNTHFGVVEEISLRSTKITTLDGLSVVIPNKDVIQNPMTNYTETDERRVELHIGVSYAEDLRHVEEVSRKAVADIPGRIKNKEIDILFDEFADSSINFRLRFWINEATNKAHNDAKSQALVNIKQAFDRENINIPWPIRTIDFNIKGGKGLAPPYTQ